MAYYKFDGLLQKTGWLSPAYVHTDSDGNITHLLDSADESIAYEAVKGYALPGFQNAHSHAFQYAMAGLAERHQVGSAADDFWSWREAMYSLALTLDPDDMEAIATMLYSEMARHGYTHVAEFHYLHHDKDGKPYANLAEMGERMVVAAKNAGINITLVPMFYQQGGFGEAPQAHQRRFISATLEDYHQLWEASLAMTKKYSHANLGFGIHSLRAVQPKDVIAAIEHYKNRGPIHIHIAEQLKEIEDAEAYLGARPVEWLLNNCKVNSDYHLVHATHLTNEETEGIANAGAHVVLCPSTEGNLGDGIFPLRKYMASNGRWSIGTDSHVGLNPLEELRILDYGQRLTSHNRNTFAAANGGDSAAIGFEEALLSGRKAMGNNNEAYFSIGQPLDAAVYRSTVPLLASSELENILATIIYCGDASWNLGTLVRGKWVGQTNDKNAISNNFRTVIKQLKSR